MVEELHHAKGTGVILSPRDLKYRLASDYASRYRVLGAAIGIDLQFYNPAFTNRRLKTYPTDQFRMSVSELRRIGDVDLARFCESLEAVNRSVGSSVLIAPAVLYEAENPGIVDLNERLFVAARAVGNTLGIPTWATVFVGRSVAESDDLLSNVLSAVTSLNCDGWYFAFEFPEAERLPTSDSTVRRFAEAVLSLACTGSPVFHAYAGPMAILSMAVGAAAAGVGHWQNLWHFHRTLWETARDSQGGGGGAPPRYWARALWGTIIYPDETARLDAATREAILQPSPFSEQVAHGLAWDRWQACKHLVSVICDEIEAMSGLPSTRERLQHVKQLLEEAVARHAAIAAQGVTLKDSTSSYQSNWRKALEQVEANRGRDLDYLMLLGGP